MLTAPECVVVTDFSGRGAYAIGYLICEPADVAVRLADNWDDRAGLVTISMLGALQHALDTRSDTEHLCTVLDIAIEPAMPSALDRFGAASTLIHVN